MDLCSKIGSGATPKGGKNAYLGGEYALIRSQNVLHNDFSNEGLAFIDDDQAKNLEKLLNKSHQQINFIFFLNVEKSAIIKRIEKRKVLEKRSDDDANTILKRYDTYMEVTKPVLEFYSKNDNFHEVDGSMEIRDISLKIEEILNV